MTTSRDIPTSIAPGDIWLSPSSPRSWPLGSDACSSQPIHIAVLDSSFNPPTLAHLALASSPFPPAPPGAENNKPYTAHLLLFSLTNVEKKPQPSDPSLSQRLEMVSRLSASIPNTAIGLINEPTFVGKSQIIHRYLSHLNRAVSLSFIVGTDTLIRFFDPRFYKATPGGIGPALFRFFEEEGSTLVSARRGGKEERETEEALLQRDEVKRWVEKGSVRLFGTGEEDWVVMSSTKVREAIAKGDTESVRQIVTPEIAEYLEQEELYR